MPLSIDRRSVIGRGICFAAGGALAGPATSQAPPSEPVLQYGVYDPEHRFATSQRLAIEHVFVRWQPQPNDRLAAAARYAAARNRWLMVTVEPWPGHGLRAVSLFEDIVRGAYDADIAGVCNDIGSAGSPLFVRWGQEMEDPAGRYPWAQENANGYVRAYRYFVDKCREAARQAYFVWSPKGKSGMAAYYPGANYADHIGVSVYGLEQWDLDHADRAISYDERFRDIYGFASRYNRPVMIAELGVAGDWRYRLQWLSQLALSGKKFPMLRNVVYFNARDPEPWPGSYGAPDWRIDPGEFP